MTIFDIDAATLIKRSLHWALPATSAERVVALWAFAYFFMLLAGYYVLRPLRDQMGIAGGVKTLPWMFTATFVTLLVLQPIYGALVKKLPRRWFIAIVYQFFVANLAPPSLGADASAGANSSIPTGVTFLVSIALVSRAVSLHRSNAAMPGREYRESPNSRRIMRAHSSQVGNSHQVTKRWGAASNNFLCASMQK
jgi:hypothetical protein